MDRSGLGNPYLSIFLPVGVALATEAKVTSSHRGSCSAQSFIDGGAAGPVD